MIPRGSVMWPDDGTVEGTGVASTYVSVSPIVRARCQATRFFYHTALRLSEQELWMVCSTLAAPRLACATLVV